MIYEQQENQKTKFERLLLPLLSPIYLNFSEPTEEE